MIDITDSIARPEAHQHFSPCRLFTHSFSDDALHGARESRRHTKTPVVQDVHRHLETSAQLTKQAVCWDADVIEVHLGCVRRLDAHFLLRRAAGVRKTSGVRMMHSDELSSD